MLDRFIPIGNRELFIKQILDSAKIELKGTVRYDPERKGLKGQSSCCVLEVDSGVSDFYRNQINKEYGINLIKPSWAIHISIVEAIDVNDSIHFIENWKKYEGTEVLFKYSVFPRFSGDLNGEYLDDCGWFWFLDVDCYLINKIRNELGLDDHKKPHLTIGRKLLKLKK